MAARFFKYLVVILAASALLVGCSYSGIHSSEPAFNPKDSLEMEELMGNYSPLDEDEEYMAITNRDGLPVASILSCEVRDRDDVCDIEFSVFNLPSFEDIYVGQFIEEDESGNHEVLYFYLFTEEKRWGVCFQFEDENILDEIMHSATLHDLEYEIEDGIKITGGMTSESMLGFLNAVWFKTSLDFWECGYLIPEDRSREELLEDLREKIDARALPQE